MKTESFESNKRKSFFGGVGLGGKRLIWLLGEGSGSPLQYSCLANPIEELDGLQAMGRSVGHD